MALSRKDWQIDWQPAYIEKYHQVRIGKAQNLKSAAMNTDWAIELDNRFVFVTSSEAAARLEASRLIAQPTPRMASMAELNEKREKRGLDTRAPVTLTKDQLEDHLHQIDTLPDALSAPVKPQPVAVLLKRLNVIRVKQGKASISAWKESRAKLFEALKKAENDKAHVTIQKLKPVVLDGANTTRFHTKMHTNRVEKAVRTMGKKEARAKLKAQRALVEDLSARAGFTRASVMRYVTVKDYVTLKDLPEAWNAECRAFIDNRASALKPARKQKASKGVSRARTGGDFLTPADIAQLTGLAPRAVRIVLRKREKELKAPWRNAAAGRWAFVKAHQADIVKFIKGGK